MTADQQTKEGAAEQLGTTQLVELIAGYALDKKARDVIALDLGGISGFTDQFVICSGTSDRQARAIHEGIHFGLKKEHGLLPRRVEGVGESRWILMDYLDVVVHVFTPETRDFYRLFAAPGMGHCSGGPGPNTFDTAPDCPAPFKIPRRPAFKAILRSFSRLFGSTRGAPSAGQDDEMALRARGLQVRGKGYRASRSPDCPAYPRKTVRVCPPMTAPWTGSP